MQPAREPRLRVIVADGHATNRTALARMLESLGAIVDVVSNGRDAVARLRNGACDLAFLDCEMPVMTGPEATVRIRGSELPGRRLPVVAMTLEQSAECHGLCLESGMDDILLKPVRERELAGVVERWAPVCSRRLGADR